MPRPSDAPAFFSASGFDIIGILTRVASRPSPRVFIGPVDFSCCFLVADALQPDFPTVYVSPAFTKLTGYDASEFVGRNCRFLQTPHDGPREPGAEMANDSAVKGIRRALAVNEEFQTTLINYRKNGQMFFNLITIIPITWDGDGTRYWVGFQADIGEMMAKDAYPSVSGSSSKGVARHARVSVRLQQIAASHTDSKRPREALDALLVDQVDGKSHFPRDVPLLVLIILKISSLPFLLMGSFNTFRPRFTLR
ncbi:hypothetical protein BS47DRAFT_1298854 [Hydnum rufescens UP504]|uniref:PAS domain-containing protein n=1 Tax=Hydnum rufescens UP504 TaxID=1448309 RepID=A0A9P6DUB5_9AGAM|nr:hypothetical protein BS47DRAFT_1298854 [Hydnum rufescens UP504]